MGSLVGGVGVEGGTELEHTGFCGDAATDDAHVSKDLERVFGLATCCSESTAGDCKLTLKSFESTNGDESGEPFDKACSSLRAKPKD